MSFRIVKQMVQLGHIPEDVSKPVLVQIPGPYSRVLEILANYSGSVEFLLVGSDDLQAIYDMQLAIWEEEQKKPEEKRDKDWTSKPVCGRAHLLIWPVDYVGESDVYSPDQLRFLGQALVNEKACYILACDREQHSIFGGGLFGGI
jgi:hypothetical protein